MKASVIHAGKRIKKKKTSTKRNTLNPIWNEALVFSLSKDLLECIEIELVVYNDNLLGQNDALGKVLIGPDSTGEEKVHWKDMINGRDATARYHLLKSP